MPLQTSAVSDSPPSVASIEGNQNDLTRSPAGFVNPNLLSLMWSQIGYGSQHGKREAHKQVHMSRQHKPQHEKNFLATACSSQDLPVHGICSLLSGSPRAMHVRWPTFLLCLWAIPALSLPQNAAHANGTSFNSTSTATALSDTLGGDCFTDARLLLASHSDCLNAANLVLKAFRYPHRPYYFARQSNLEFMLPQVFRYGTCVISLDVAKDDEDDVFMPWEAFSNAVGLATKCFGIGEGLGGKIFIGPKKVVYMIVFGRKWPPVVGEEEGGADVAIEGMSLTSAAGREVNGGVSTTMNISSLANPPSSQEQIASDDSVLDVGPPVLDQVAGERSAQNISVSVLNGSSVMQGPMVCYDPPLPRERLFPYESSDCDRASQKIVGNRQKWDAYIFSRKRPSYSPRWYEMPATFTHKTCVIHVDMANDKDEDFVRVNYVEASAWVLAHKCSGEEVAQQKYGGYMTVGVGGNHLIWVHVYGRPWPPRAEDRSVPSLLRNASVDEE